MADQPNELRRRLVEIDDEIRALPTDAFAARYELDKERDLLRTQLAELVESELGPVAEQWAERSGRKGSHTTDYDVERAKAAIPSPLHSN